MALAFLAPSFVPNQRSCKRPCAGSAGASLTNPLGVLGCRGSPNGRVISLRLCSAAFIRRSLSFDAFTKTSSARLLGLGAHPLGQQ